MTTRQNKIAKQIQKDIAEIVQGQSHEIAPGKMLTVTNVRVTADLSIARIYISVFPSDKGGDYISLLNTHVGFYRNALGKKLRHQVKKIPELNFFLDDSLDYIDNIDKLLNN